MHNNLKDNSFSLVFFVFQTGDEGYVIVETPPFAESVTEGDVRWDKCEYLKIKA